MNIEEYDIVTLDNDVRYIVAKTINYKNIKYYFLCEEKNPKKYMFCYIENNLFIKVKDQKLIDILSLMITKEVLS